MGNLIQFSQGEEQIWEVINLDAPKDMLIGLNNTSPTQKLSSVHLLPNDEDPQATVYFSQDHLSWVLDSLDAKGASITTHQEVLTHQAIVNVNTHCWQLHLAKPNAQTLEQATKHSIEHRPENYRFHFTVSLDEEHIFLTLESEHQNVNLGERSHHYLLLHLARTFHQHKADGIDADNCGWIDLEQLSQELGLESNHLNIQVFRARKQFSSSCALNNSIQRRRGQLRLLCPSITIHKGDNLELNDTATLLSGSKAP
jgi:hypothetical protein